MTEPNYGTGSAGDQPYYGAPPPAASAPRPFGPPPTAPRALATASVVIAIALTVVEVGTAILSWHASGEFVDGVEGGGSTWDVLTPYDVVELLLFPLMIAAYVVSCIWLQSARRTAQAVRPEVHHHRGPVWVWLGWWVPIVAFWFPYQVVRDVQTGSTRRGASMGLGLWWTCWLVYMIGNRVTAQLASADSVDGLEALPFAEVITAVAVIVGCVQWRRIVLSITADQEKSLAQR